MPEPFTTFAATCAHRLTPATLARAANALAVEVAFAPADRCAAQPPQAWRGADPYGHRWRSSGGDALVFGRCLASRCPLFAGEGTPGTVVPRGGTTP